MARVSKYRQIKALQAQGMGLSSIAVRLRMPLYPRTGDAGRAAPSVIGVLLRNKDLPEQWRNILVDTGDGFRGRKYEDGRSSSSSSDELSDDIDGDG